MTWPFARKQIVIYYISLHFSRRDKTVILQNECVVDIVRVLIYARKKKTYIYSWKRRKFSGEESSLKSPHQHEYIRARNRKRIKARSRGRVQWIFRESWKTSREKNKGGVTRRGSLHYIRKKKITGFASRAPAGENIPAQSSLSLFLSDNRIRVDESYISSFPRGYIKRKVLREMPMRARGIHCVMFLLLSVSYSSTATCSAAFLLCGMRWSFRV